MIRKFILSLFLLIGLLCTSLCLLLFTEPGLHLALAIARPFIPGHLQVKGLHGRLWDGIRCDQLIWQDAHLKAHQFEQINAAWQWQRQPLGQLNYQISLKAPPLPGLIQLDGQLWPRPPYPIQAKVHWQALKKIIGTALFDIKGDSHQLQIKLNADLKKPILAQAKATARWLRQQLQLHSQVLLLGKSIGLQLHWRPKQTPALDGQLNSEALDLKPSGLDLQIKPLQLHFQGNNAQDWQAQTNLQAQFQANSIQTQLRYQSGKLGTAVQPGTLHLGGQFPNWAMAGTVLINQQPIKLSGTGRLQPQAVGQLQLQAEAFQLIDTDELKITAQPDLQLEFGPQSLNLKGKIRIPKAQITPDNFADSLSLSDDVVYEQGEGESQGRNNALSAQVEIEMGDAVYLSVKGLSGYLTGSLHVDKSPQRPANASGELAIVKGHYSLYGQTLQVTEGRLIFSGGLIDNPGINLTAIRRFKTTMPVNNAGQLFSLNQTSQDLLISGKTTVGVQISGRLKSPKIELFSIPANLSQADILSLLILGKPASQANQAGGQLLIGALSSLNLGGGSKGKQLISQLQKSLGVDISLTNDANYNPQTNQVSDSRGLMVSKNLSKRLQVSYNVGLSQGAGNVLTLKYLLTQFFNLQVTASDTSNGIDLFYTRQSR